MIGVPAVFHQHRKFIEGIDAYSIARRRHEPAAWSRKIGRPFLPAACLLALHLLFRAKPLPPLAYHRTKLGCESRLLADQRFDRSVLAWPAFRAAVPAGDPGLSFALHLVQMRLALNGLKTALAQGEDAGCAEASHDRGTHVILNQLIEAFSTRGSF